MNEFPKISQTEKEEHLKSLGSIIDKITKDVDDSRRMLSSSEEIEIKAKGLNLDFSLKYQKRLLEYRLIIGLLYLDLLSTVRNHLKADFKYEVLFSTRQINVIIIEGIKKIYHFKQENRKNTFWVKDIKKIIEKDLPELKTKYDNLTTKIENYIATYFTNNSNQDNRNLSVHYDIMPSKVYDMLISLDIKGIYSCMLPFVNILKEMFEFTQEIVSQYNEKFKRESELAKSEFNEKNNKVK